MNQKTIKLLLLLFFLVRLPEIIAEAQPRNEYACDKQNNHELVRIDQEACNAILEIKNLFPHHDWSELCRNLCLDIEDNGNVAFYEQVDCVVNECLAVLNHQQHDHLRPLQERLTTYKAILEAGKAHTQLPEISGEAEHPQTRNKVKKICKLSVYKECVRFLTVNKLLTVNGNEIINGNLSVTGTITLGGCLLSCTSTGLAVIGATGATGATGPTGATGATGATGTSLAGAAEYINTSNSGGVNTAVAPGVAFTIGTQVYNNNSAAIVASAGDGGTVFTLAAGTYVIDYAMSLLAAGSVGIYTGATVGTLALDPNTVAGSSTATTWIHGRAIEVVSAGTSMVFAISPVVSPATVTTAGTDSASNMIRVTILKIA